MRHSGRRRRGSPAHLPRAVTTDRITLLQAQAPTAGSPRSELSFDRSDGPSTTRRGAPLGEASRPVALGDASRQAPGQEIRFPSRTFRTLRITITGTNLGDLPRWTGVSDVGIAEIAVPGVAPTTEVVRPPTDLLDALGARSTARPLSYVFQRRAADPAEVGLDDEERRMQRWVEGPTLRGFLPFGTARISGRIPGERVDALIGAPDAAHGGLTATAAATRPAPPLPAVGGGRRRRRLPGGHRSTTVGDWIESPTCPVTVDDLTMAIVADGRHSVPTKVSLQVDNGQAHPGPGRRRLVARPSGRDGRPHRARGARPRSGADGIGHRHHVPVHVDEVAEVRSLDWFSGTPTVPGRHRQLGLPTRAARPMTLGCRRRAGPIC